MDASPAWIATVAVAVVCLAYSWLLGIAARRHGIHLGRIGPTVGVAGALILAGMAVVGPQKLVERKAVDSMQTYTLEGYPRISRSVAHYAKLLSIASRTTHEVGRRPSKNHVAYEHSDGKLEWITKKKYAKLTGGE